MKLTLEVSVNDLQKIQESGRDWEGKPMTEFVIQELNGVTDRDVSGLEVSQPYISVSDETREKLEKKKRLAENKLKELQGIKVNIPSSYSRKWRVVRIEP